MSADEKRAAIAEKESQGDSGALGSNASEEARRAALEAQNLTAANAVPEQRPQAMTTIGNPPRSKLAQRVLDAGDPDGIIGGLDSEPHDQAAYDRAASKAQAQKAADSSTVEGLMVGNRAIASKGPYEGEHFAITRIVEEGSPADLVRRMAGRPEQLYNQPKQVEARLIGGDLDGVLLILDVEANGLEKQNEEVGGSKAGRRH